MKTLVGPMGVRILRIVISCSRQSSSGEAAWRRVDAGVVTRVPRSADIVTTALAVLGVNGVRISGGNGEILGVRMGS